jgi:Flp pilus assembly pilin Flp
MVRQCVGLSGNIKRFTADAAGATAIEHSLIVVGIALAIVVSVGLLGGALNLFFGDL